MMPTIQVQVPYKMEPYYIYLNACGWGSFVPCNCSTCFTVAVPRLYRGCTSSFLEIFAPGLNSDWWHIRYLRYRAHKITLRAWADQTNNKFLISLLQNPISSTQNQFFRSHVCTIILFKCSPHIENKKKIHNLLLFPFQQSWLLCKMTICPTYLLLGTTVMKRSGFQTKLGRNQSSRERSLWGYIVNSCVGHAVSGNVARSFSFFHFFEVLTILIDSLMMSSHLTTI